ncbi:hypothetical protein BGZ57DRAFT_631987 [Hyaloscypha finlandica]|nr:hypothetical protein BGZ57DRAFT_631987 [Hyaloscypha finlandica]
MAKGVPKGFQGGEGVGVGEVLNPAHAFAGHGRGQQKAAAGSSRRTLLEAGPKAPRGWREELCCAWPQFAHSNPTQPIPTHSNQPHLDSRAPHASHWTDQRQSRVGLELRRIQSWTRTGARTGARTRTRTTRQSQISRRLQSRTLSASVPHHAPISTSPHLTSPHLTFFTSPHYTSLHFTSGSSLQLAAGQGLANSAGPSSASLHRSPSLLLASSTRTQPPVLCKDEGIILAVSKAGTPIFSYSRCRLMSAYGVQMSDGRHAPPGPCLAKLSQVKAET